MKAKIFKVDDGDGSYFLIYQSKEEAERYHDNAIEITIDDITTDELIQLLDNEAEYVNEHSIVGAAKELQLIIEKNAKLGTSGNHHHLCKRILWDIALRGGLHCLTV